MSRSCWCMVVIVILVLFTGVEGKTTQEFLQQTFVGRSVTNQTRTDISTQDRSFVARLVVVDPSVKSLMDPMMTPIPQGSEPLIGLRDVDLKQLIAIEQTSLENLTGMPQSEAKDAIHGAGLKVGKVTYDYSDTIPAGCVVRQEPQAGFVNQRAEVDLVIAQTKLAIHRFPLERGIGGETESYGQLIVHRLFDVELKTPIQNIPIFAIADKGYRHNSKEARAQSIVENLLMAWSVLDEGGQLETAPDNWIMPDDEERWRLRGPFAPGYPTIATAYPAIYVRSPKFSNTPLRVMTVFPKDAELFGQPSDEMGIPTRFTQKELAEYLVSLIQAHYTLLAKRSSQLEDFENLEICKTREGKIFKEICLRALEETRMTNPIPSSIDDLRSALSRVALSQRYRLLTLAFNAPRDWRLRDSN